MNKYGIRNYFQFELIYFNVCSIPGNDDRNEHTDFHNE